MPPPLVGRVAADSAVADRQGAVIIVDASAAAVERAIGDGQARDGDGLAAVNGEDSER